MKPGQLILAVGGFSAAFVFVLFAFGFPWTPSPETSLRQSSWAVGAVAVGIFRVTEMTRGEESSGLLK